MEVRVDGITIASKAVLYANIFGPITMSPLSRVTSLKEVHLENAESPLIIVIL